MLINPRWRKVMRDLWLNKNRTIVVVLSIAVGVFAVGVIATSQVVLSDGLIQTYLATRPAHATIMTFNAFDDDMVKAVEGMREVSEATGRGRVIARMQVGPDEWRGVFLVAIPDYDNMEIDRISSEKGAWPPPENEILIERAALPLTNAEMGDTVLIKTADGEERHVKIAGLAHDLNAQIYVFDGTVYGFITMDTLEWMTGERNYSELKLRVAENTDDREHIRRVTNQARDKLEDAGLTVWYAFIPQPGQPQLYFLIQAISIILGALGLLSLLLSGFLVVNTISALLTQQTRQIGMMKAVGARTGQVMGMYLVTVLIFGGLALLIAIPLGVAGAYYFSRFIAGFLNFDVENFRLPLEVLMAEIAVGLLIPLLAALVPIIKGVRVTVREAISEYGLGKGRFGTGLIDRLLVAFQYVALLRHRVSRPLLVSLRNTFRRKGRLALTLITLVLAGSIFIAVFSVRASLMDTIDMWMDYFQYDVAVLFNRDYRVERLIQETLKVPAVEEAECWGFYNARRLRPDGTNSDNIMVMAPPADTSLVNPTMVEGRWLMPEDENALVVNTVLLRDEPDLQLGDIIILKIEGREQKWHIVGIAAGGMPMATVFANYPYFAHVAHDLNRAEYIFLKTSHHSAEYQNQVARLLEQHYERLGMEVNMAATMAQEKEEAEAMFEVIVVLLLIMTVLLAVIGGLGLMGTMSINVLERIREIGVMRAIGASDGSVRRIFIVEGVIIGILSWVMAAALSYPIGKALSSAVGHQFLGVSLEYTFSVGGVLTWLVVVTILAALASFLPAWNASRLTVREVLAYE